MNDRLTAEIERIRSSSSIPTLDEAAVKQGVILRVLNALGWDTFDIEEVKPEHSVGSRKVDYALRLDGRNRVFLEAKRPSEDLGNHAPQLLDYSFREGVPLAVLTNGLTWWFYLPLQEGNWEERRFSVIELLNLDVSQTTNCLKDFLSRENVHSGVAVGLAEGNLYRLWQNKKIEEALPKAWNQIITDPHDQLLALLNQKVMKLCGWGANLDQLKHFLANLPKPTPAPPATTPTPIAPRTRIPKLAEQNVSDYLNKKPASFAFDGQNHRVTKWWELLTSLAEQIYLKHPGDFHRVIELKGAKRHYFSQNKQGMQVPKPIGSSGYYAETKLAAPLCVTVCHRLLAKFGYREQDLVIETT